MEFVNSTKVMCPSNFAVLSRPELGLSCLSTITEFSSHMEVLGKSWPYKRGVRPLILDKIHTVILWLLLLYLSAAVPTKFTNKSRKITVILIRRVIRGLTFSQHMYAD